MFNYSKYKKLKQIFRESNFFRTSDLDSDVHKIIILVLITINSFEKF